jgi:phosphatidate cytidylyltransferase
MLKSRIITAMVLLAILLLALFLLPPVLWAALIVLMVMQGATEWSRLSGLTGRMATLYSLLSVLIMAGLAMADLYLAQETRFGLQLVVYSVSALLWLVLVPSWLMAGWKITHPYLMALVGWAVLLPTGLAMMDLRAAAPAPWLLLFVMGLVWVADSAAYFAGRRFGKNKLAPSISPGKTWEGVTGAVFGVSVYVVLVWSFSPLFSERQILPPLVLTAWWWVVLAVIGDLFESAIKRQAGVKDSGALLPGHGGLLDRIDALTSTLPLAALALLFQGFN